MDLKTRIRRRQRSGDTDRLILDYGAISPVAHVEEPVGRGPVLERLLDYFDPVFDGRLPPNAYVWGPGGGGKSAVMTALVGGFDALLSPSESVIHTATRARAGGSPAFVYANARRATSDFALYRAVLDRVLDDQVPEQGVGTDRLRSRLEEYLDSYDRRLLVVVDHVGEPGTFRLPELAATFDPVDGALGWVAVGRTPPAEIEDAALPPERIRVPAYEEHALVDILTARASDGLADRAVTHEQTRRIAGWAEGDAHHALAALFGAADRAVEADQSRVRERDLEAGMNAVPRPCVPLGRVLALPETRQRVLWHLLDLDESDRRSVDAATTAVAARPGVDLSPSTIKRFLYELAEAGVVERVRVERKAGQGRPPSRVEPRFPTRVFRRLYELTADDEP